MESFMTSSPSLHTEIQLEENSGGYYEEMFSKDMEAWHRKDYATSFPAFKMLADSGYSKACGYLGIAYELGEGVARNWQMAESLYEMSIKTHDHDPFDPLNEDGFRGCAAFFDNGGSPSARRTAGPAAPK